MVEYNKINAFNENHLSDHKRNWDFLMESLAHKSIDLDELINEIGNFQISIPSWALGTGGTRFGRFPQGGEPSCLEEKIREKNHHQQLVLAQS